MLVQTMALISRVKSTDASFRTLHIAGMIKKLCCSFLESDLNTKQLCNFFIDYESTHC